MHHVHRVIAAQWKGDAPPTALPAPYVHLHESVSSRPGMICSVAINMVAHHVPLALVVIMMEGAEQLAQKRRYARYCLLRNPIVVVAEHDMIYVVGLNIGELDVLIATAVIMITYARNPALCMPFVIITKQCLLAST